MAARIKKCLYDTPMGKEYRGTERSVNRETGVQKNGHYMY